MSELVPQITSSVDEVYSNTSAGASPEQKARFKNLVDSFKKTYGTKPDYVARSPGRVNIIGEHVDYSLYNVLPTAVTVDVLVAFKAKEPQDGALIKVANTNPSKYPTKEFHVPEDGKAEMGKHEWSNYFKAGLNGSFEYLQKHNAGTFKPKSMEVMMDGNVPAGGGLSSSAAFVCASALAVMTANDYSISKQDLLDLCIVSERAVGVFSGGMDQAASIFSARGYLLYCRFYPEFTSENVPVPASDPEFTFLIAQSFVTSDKAVTAPIHYNLRVVECTLATVVLAKLHGIALNPDSSSLGFCLRNFQVELMKKEGKDSLPLAEQLDLLIDVIGEKLKDEPYTREDVSDVLDISVENVEKEYMSKFPVRADGFKLKQRALHVVKEARRVIEFKDTLTSSSDSGKKLTSKEVGFLGDLMNTTQASCRDVYECSCPEIDEMCKIARNAGALGSRLTGAGWGGCTVHLVPMDKVDAVEAALKKEYYNKKFPDMSKDQLEQAFVVSKPGQGTSLIGGDALNV